jgi:iron complex outermembrane recepter protein
MRKVCLSFVVLFEFSLLVATGVAQSPAVTGRVVDAQGASVTGAEVALLPGIGLGRTTRSTADGTFSIEAMAAGQHTLVVRAPGFAEFSQQVTVGTGPATVNVTLQVAGLVEDVTVQGALLGTAATGKTNLPVRDLPMTVHTVPGKVIQEQGANDLVTALQNVPGVYAFTNYGVYEGYTFRGFMDLFPSLANQLLDGVRHEGNRINTQLTNIDRIEVLKGPSSALYGGGATGGTGDTIRKKPAAAGIPAARSLAPQVACRPTPSSIVWTSGPRPRKATATTSPGVSSSRRRWPGGLARATR